MHATSPISLKISIERVIEDLALAGIDALHFHVAEGNYSLTLNLTN